MPRPPSLCLAPSRSSSCLSSCSYFFSLVAAPRCLVQTGTVSAGTLAGLLAATIAGVVGAIITIAQTAADPGAIRDAASLVNPSVSSSPLSDEAIVIIGVISAVIGLLFLLGLGAGMGTLGGLLGRQKYQPGSYQESMYQGLPLQ